MEQWMNRSRSGSAEGRGRDLEGASLSDQKRREIPISVVIPAHNEEQYLPATLEALSRQTYRNYEVVVVANGCTDRTEELARGHCHNLLSLPERGLSRARNFGGVKARGELLVFLDADTMVEPACLETIAREFSREFAMGTLRGRPASEKLVYRALYFLKNFAHRTRLHYGSSGLIICWKDYFKAAGGFDETLHVCEISDFMKKLRRFGKYKYIGSTCATTSMRRYEKKGAGEMLWLWLKVGWLALFSDLRHRSYEPVR